VYDSAWNDGLVIEIVPDPCELVEMQSLSALYANPNLQYLCR